MANPHRGNEILRQRIEEDERRRQMHSHVEQQRYRQQQQSQPFYHASTPRREHDYPQQQYYYQQQQQRPYHNHQYRQDLSRSEPAAPVYDFKDFPQSQYHTAPTLNFLAPIPRSASSPSNVSSASIDKVNFREEAGSMQRSFAERRPDSLWRRMSYAVYDQSKKQAPSDLSQHPTGATSSWMASNQRERNRMLWIRWIVVLLLLSGGITALVLHFVLPGGSVSTAHTTPSIPTLGGFNGGEAGFSSDVFSKARPSSTPSQALASFITPTATQAR